jgi:hypothetical protein
LLRRSGYAKAMQAGLSSRDIQFIDEIILIKTSNRITKLFNFGLIIGFHNPGISGME